MTNNDKKLVFSDSFSPELSDHLSSFCLYTLSTFLLLLLYNHWTKLNQTLNKTSNILFYYTCSNREQHFIFWITTQQICVLNIHNRHCHNAFLVGNRRNFTLLYFLFTSVNFNVIIFITSDTPPEQTTLSTNTYYSHQKYHRYHCQNDEFNSLDPNWQFQAVVWRTCICRTTRC